MENSSSARWSIFNADTVEVAASMPTHSVDFSVYSPPFSSLFVYSPSPRDMGNVSTDEEFFAGYDFLIKEQMRVMKPGRLIAIHCMNLPSSKVRDGIIGLKDFRGDLIRAHQKHGMIYHSEICVWKCPVAAVTRTKALGLLYKQLRKDSAMSRQGIADYVVVMRTPGTNPDPVTKNEESFPVERWQRYASPVWVTTGEADDEGFLRCSDDETPDPDSGIDPSDTLNGHSAREEKDERHLACLQLGVIRRCIRLWSNPNEVVWTPFLGIGSELYVALQEGRRGVGAELKRSYFLQAVRNLQAAERPAQADLFASVAP